MLGDDIKIRSRAFFLVLFKVCLQLSWSVANKFVALTAGIQVIFLELIVGDGEVAKVRLVALGKVMFQSGLVIETYRLVTFGVLSAPGKRTE